MNNKEEAADKRYSYAEAHAIALAVLEELRPHCIRAEIGGSIRRKKEFVKDIEVILIPRPYSTGLLEDGLASVINKWTKIKGEMKYGKTKYTQRLLPGGIALDIFFATPENWGQTFALRTGSAEYSHKVLARGWCKRGFESIGGYLTKRGQRYEIREEQDLFDLIGIPYVPPEERDL